MTPWKLTTKLNEHNTDYEIKSFACSCGNNDFITIGIKQKLEYICPICNNNKFYDANSAWKHIDNFLNENEDVILLFEYCIDLYKDKIISGYAAQIPFDIDFLNKKIIYANKSRFSLTLTSNGFLEESSASTYYKPVFLKLHFNLTQYINKNSCFNTPDTKGKNFNLQTASFFLKNKHLRDFEFYFWDDIEMLPHIDTKIDGALEYITSFRNEKSIKRSVYQNYVKQLSDNGRFYSLYIEVFCKNIDDINILVKLLKLELDYAENHIVDKENLNLFIYFLKTKYTEVQILNLFDKYDFNTDSYLFRDTVIEFNYEKSVIENEFRKVPCNVKSIHDEFVRCLRDVRHKNMQNQTLQYLEKDMKPCIEVNDYHVKLPKNGKELFKWAEELHNCIAGYFDMIKYKKAIVYGFFQNDILVFVVEINDKNVVQASGKYNAKLTIDNNNILTEWLKLFFQKDKEIIKNAA